MLAAPLLLLLKAHNKGYTKKDGTFVAPFDDKRATAAPKPSKPPPKQIGLFGGFMAGDHAKDVGQAPPKKAAPWSGKSEHKPLPPGAVAHPRKGEKGQTVMIHYPSHPSEPSTWNDPEVIATFTPGCALPASLNGVPLSPWADAPQDADAWDYVEGQNDELEEPGMELPKGKVPASGVIVLEPDGRCWVVAPTNRFGGTKNTFPKGSRDFALSLQANAIKECYEECGLKVEIDSFLGDIVRSTSVARYYLARRVGGTPGAMGWESQAVRLVPVGQLEEFLDRGDDKKVASWVAALG